MGKSFTILGSIRPEKKRVKVNFGSLVDEINLDSIFLDAFLTEVMEYWNIDMRHIGWWLYSSTVKTIGTKYTKSSYI